MSGKRYEQTIVLLDSLRDLTTGGWSNVSGGGVGENNDQNNKGSLATAGPDGQPCIETVIGDGSTYRRVRRDTLKTIDAQGAEPAQTTGAIFLEGTFGVWVKTPDKATVTLGLIIWRDRAGGAIGDNGYYQTFPALNTAETIANSYDDEWFFFKWNGDEMNAAGGAPAWGDGQWIDAFDIGIHGTPSGDTYSCMFSDYYVNIEAGRIR